MENLTQITLTQSQPCHQQIIINIEIHIKVVFYGVKIDVNVCTIWYIASFHHITHDHLSWDHKLGAENANLCIKTGYG